MHSALHLSVMGYSEEAPPRHGHRTPADLAEDEQLAAVHGHVCAPRHMEEAGPIGTESERQGHLEVPFKPLELPVSEER